MKKCSGRIGVMLILMMPVTAALCQSLPLNESGHCVYEEVVPLDLSDSALYSKAYQWLHQLLREQHGEIVRTDSVQKSFIASMELPLYAQSGILKKLSGVMTYEVTVQVKPGKYRFSFRHFVFHYYSMDRTYKMVKTGKTKPIEDPKAAGWQKLWTQHQITVASKITEERDQLKAKMKEQPQDENANEKKKLEW